MGEIGPVGPAGSKGLSVSTNPLMLYVCHLHFIQVHCVMVFYVNDTQDKTVGCRVRRVMKDLLVIVAQRESKERVEIEDQLKSKDKKDEK